MDIGTAIIVWILCAGLAYFIARDRAPSQAPLATLLGFVFGPIGVGISFFLKEANVDDSPEGEVGKAAQVPSELALDVDNEIPPKSVRSLEEISADIERLKQRQ